MDLRVFLGASPSRTEVHSKVSTKPGMQKAENSPAQFQAKNAIKPQQDSKRETKHRVTVLKCRMSVKYRSFTWDRKEAFQLPLCPCSSPGALWGTGNDTRNRVLMAFTSQSFEQQIINFSHSIINAFWWFSLHGNLRTRRFWSKGEKCYFKIYPAWCMMLRVSVLSAK